MSTLSQLRRFHNFLAPIFFVFFFLVSITAILLAFKSSFSNVLYQNSEIHFSKSIRKWMPLDSLEPVVTQKVNEYTHSHFKRSEKAEVKIDKGSLIYYYKGGIVAQVNGESGDVINIDKKFGGIIQDIHDGAILDSVITTKDAYFKKLYSVIVGLALLIMTITGIYLWYKPIVIRKSKKSQH